MFGGYLSFAGIENKARYAMTLWQRYFRLKY